MNSQDSAERKLDLDILEEPQGEVYEQLVRYAFSISQEFLLVVDPKCRLELSGGQLLDRLKPHLIKHETVSEWPATKRLSHDTVNAYYHKCNDETYQIFIQATQRLYAWRPAKLPQDPCFFRSGEPWLVTISREQESSLTVSAKELQDIRKEVPNLKLRFYHRRAINTLRNFADVMRHSGNLKEASDSEKRANEIECELQSLQRKGVIDSDLL